MLGGKRHHQQLVILLENTHQTRVRWVLVLLWRIQTIWTHLQHLSTALIQCSPPSSGVQREGGALGPRSRVVHPAYWLDTPAPPLRPRARSRDRHGARGTLLLRNDRRRAEAQRVVGQRRHMVDESRNPYDCIAKRRIRYWYLGFAGKYPVQCSCDDVFQISHSEMTLFSYRRLQLTMHSMTLAYMWSSNQYLSNFNKTCIFWSSV